MPTRGGLPNAVEAAVERGCEAFQLFASNPRAWMPPQIDDDIAGEFRSAVREAKVGPVFVHAPYLVNIASPNEGFLRKSVGLARASMAATEAIGAAGLVVHAGAGGAGERERAVERAARALTAIAEEASDAWLVVELMAGGAGAVASGPREARELFDAASMHPRVRLCLDTCHLFAAGYALDTDEGVAGTFAELRSAGLSRRLVLIHGNDAKFARGSHRDRHEHVGEGRIGGDGFRAILAQPAVRRAAVVVETDGDAAANRRDVETLRKLCR